MQLTANPSSNMTISTRRSANKTWHRKLALGVGVRHTPRMIVGVVLANNACLPTRLLSCFAASLLRCFTRLTQCCWPASSYGQPLLRLLVSSYRTPGTALRSYGPEDSCFSWPGWLSCLPLLPQQGKAASCPYGLRSRSGSYGSVLAVSWVRSARSAERST